MAMKLHLFALISFLLVATSMSATLMRTKYPPGTAPGVPVLKTSTAMLKSIYPPGTSPKVPVLFASKPKTTPPMVKPPTTTSPVAKPPTSTPPTTPVATPPSAAPPTPPRNTKECYPLCVVRCKFHSRQNVCLRACVTCCDRCKCVPPGQSGNQEVCGNCYTNMKTHGGRPKCP